MKQVFIFILVLIFALVFSGYILSDDSNTVSSQKPINFSHQLHVKDAEMSCADCHSMVNESQAAGDRNIPEKDICAGCHDVEDESSCNMCHVDVDNPGSFPNPERGFSFNHAKHLEMDKMKCETCHAGIENQVISDGSGIPPRETCNECHNGLDASMQCMQCHVMGTKLRPDDHNLNWSRQHMAQIRSGNGDCAHCHTNNYCQECHESVDLVSTKILPNDYYANYSPHLQGQETMVVKSVHDLNFRFTHPMEALGKDKECQTCHETSFYCAECHSNENGQAGIRPAWHGGPDWGALAMGVGSGGGRHGEMARRDIERCASCHDVQGADPSCLMCHSDFDGIRNTDPKTHDSGFSNRFGEGAEFHNDDAAMCFSCHVNTKQAGVGFCGYCHGTGK